MIERGFEEAEPGEDGCRIAGIEGRRLRGPRQRTDLNPGIRRCPGERGNKNEGRETERARSHGVSSSCDAADGSVPEPAGCSKPTRARGPLAVTRPHDRRSLTEPARGATLPSFLFPS